MRFALLAVLALLTLPLPATAQEQLLAQYVADLGPEDHFNSSGTRLTTFGALLAQDRANYHRFGIRHRNDGADPIFSDRGMRAQIAAKFQMQGYQMEYTQLILRNRPPGTYIVVSVWGNGRTISRVTFVVPG